MLCLDQRTIRCSCNQGIPSVAHALPSFLVTRCFIDTINKYCIVSKFVHRPDYIHAFHLQVQRAGKGPGGETEELPKFPPIKAKWSTESPQWRLGLGKTPAGDSATRLKPQAISSRESFGQGIIQNIQNEQHKSSLGRASSVAAQGQPKLQSSERERSQAESTKTGRSAETAAPTALHQAASSEQRNRLSPQGLPPGQQPMMSYPPRPSLPSMPLQTNQAIGRPSPSQNESFQKAQIHRALPIGQLHTRVQSQPAPGRLAGPQHLRNNAGPSAESQRPRRLSPWQVPGIAESQPPSGPSQQQQQQQSAPRTQSSQQSLHEQKQLSRPGQKLLMLVRSGGLKLPTTVSKPTTVGNVPVTLPLSSSIMTS